MPNLATIPTNEKTQSQELSTHPIRLVAKATTPQRKKFMEPKQQRDCLTGIEDQWDRARINDRTQKTMQEQVFGCDEKFRFKMSRLRSGTVLDRLQTTRDTKIPSILQIVWQQSSETYFHNQNSGNLKKILQCKLLKRLKRSKTCSYLT